MRGGGQGISLNVGIQPFPLTITAHLLKALDAEEKRCSLPPELLPRNYNMLGLPTVNPEAALKEVGQPKECAVRRFIHKIGAGYFESAVFGTRSAIIYVTPQSHLDILIYVPDSPWLKYPGRISQIADHAQIGIE
jgi:hypothetical protein